LADGDAPAAGAAVPVKSDLPVRVASAIVMLVIAGVAIWRGGAVLQGFVAVVGLGIFAEYVGLAAKIAPDPARMAAAVITGAVYVSWATLALGLMPVPLLIGVVGLVVCTDVGAYFAGRAIGGPKIAPAISPSKTWAGLAGGMAAAAFWTTAFALFVSYAVSAMSPTGPGLDDAFSNTRIGLAALTGAGLAIAAQAGDFYESWLKRRAGVKDSSRIIPGHGGLFDRFDGLLPVAIIVGTTWAVTEWAASGGTRS